MASGTGSHSRMSPRKFSEKIALLNKKERETNRKFEEIIKEVQATKQQQHAQQVCVQQTADSSAGLSILQDQLRLIESGESYKAVHADSLEEIEKVYETLLESADQCEENENYANGQTERLPAQDEISQLPSFNDDKPGKPQTGLMFNGFMTNPSFIPQSTTTESFSYQQANNNNNSNNSFYTIRNDLSASKQHPTLKDSIAVSYGSLNPQADFPDASHLGACDSTSIGPQQEFLSGRHSNDPLSAQVRSSGYRARVVSFGSASKHKYPGVTKNVLGQHETNNKGLLQAHKVDNLIYHTQYLKEPSGDRSRQKSCSDPQLHISPNQLMIVNPTAQCSRSDNRLADHQIVDKTGYIPSEAQQPMMDCYCSSSASTGLPPDHRGIEYSSHNNYTSGEPNIDDGRQLSQKTGGIPNCAQILPAVSLASDGDRPSGIQEHLYSMCDTSSAAHQLPGIKICTIDDESAGRMPSIFEDHSKNSNSNNSTPPSRDGSLPDISNLRFGANSTCTSSEQKVIGQSQETCWIRHNLNTPITGMNSTELMSSENYNDFCLAEHTSWPSYAGSNITTTEMEVQVDSSGRNVPDHYVQEQQSDPGQVTIVQGDSRRCCLTSSSHQSCADSSSPKINSLLSNSICSFGMSPSSHQQLGSLMICTSSDYYNNVIRSHSHNNISSMDNQKQNTIANLNTMQHHASGYHSPNDNRAVVGVRRVTDSKGCGALSSPIGSSSDLNLPQSEMKPPGTQQHSENSVLFHSSMGLVNPQQEQLFPVGTLVNGDDLSLTPDASQFVSQNNL